MQFYSKSLLIIFSILIFTSCGRMNNPEIEVRKLDEEKLNEFIENQNITCNSNHSSCPSGVARVFMINKNYTGDSGFCSGFMISPDVMVTNAHCIQNSQTCRHSYISIYHSGETQFRKCASILYKQEDGNYKNFYTQNKKIDIAIIKLNQPYTGEYFKVKRTNHTDLQNNQNLTAWVVDHSGMLEKGVNRNPLNFAITELNCNVTKEKGHKSVILKKCGSISGNSGSMIVDENNNIVGLLWGGNYDGDANSSIYERRNTEWAISLITPSKYFFKYAQ